MQRETNNIELKSTILNWLKLNEQLDVLTFQRLNYSSYFYAKHSFTGGMLGRDEMQLYNTPVNPEYGAIKIITKERTLDKRIEVCKKKIELFSEYLSSIDQQKLIEAIKLDYVTELEHQAFEEIQEIEFYLVNHANYRIGILDHEMTTEVFEISEETKASEGDLLSRLGALLYD